MTSTAILNIALFATEQLLKQSPQLFLKFQVMLSQKDITVDQLRAKRESIATQQFEDLVPNSELAPEIEPKTQI